MPARADPAGLDVGLALRDGLRAFNRAPGAFLAFTLLVAAWVVFDNHQKRLAISILKYRIIKYCGYPP